MANPENLVQRVVNHFKTVLNSPPSESRRRIIKTGILVSAGSLLIPPGLTNAQEEVEEPEVAGVTADGNGVATLDEAAVLGDECGDFSPVPFSGYYREQYKPQDVENYRNEGLLIQGPEEFRKRIKQALDHIYQYPEYGQYFKALSSIEVADSNKTGYPPVRVAFDQYNYPLGWKSWPGSESSVSYKGIPIGMQYLEVDLLLQAIHAQQRRDYPILCSSVWTEETRNLNKTRNLEARDKVIDYLKVSGADEIVLNDSLRRRSMLANS